MGWGNQALVWFWAWRGLSRGEERLALRTPAMAPWLSVFPEAMKLTVDRSDVRFLDRRLLGGAERPDLDVGPYARDFTTAELEGFMDEVLLASTRFGDLVESRSLPADTLVLNVRRGDYFTPDHIATFGFDTSAWLQRVLPCATPARDVRRVHVVSDDLAWCRERVPALCGPHLNVTFADPSEGPVEHLATLAAAQRLVLANSTFSYWGGYLATRRGTTPDDVWAPDFFMRGHNDDRAWLLDPRWRAVPITDDAAWVSRHVPHPGPL